ncbi:MAG: glycine cleavage system aminomethyltransferase GcvT [Bryobacteraceae bacterium]|nr:glycine cleavage system aminomethyltransferase GcvT [Bryobacteraceae bacterium]MDW8378457.1 glycine cleavage system aminomethyltransferase GcvT [Bryobacterales bacterium]
MTESAAPLKQTPLYAVHRRLGAKMVEFGGWEMPVHYSSLLEEHHAVRRAVGLFDVSHMGEIEVRGPEAFALLDYLTPNALSRLSNGQAQYSALLYEHGGFVDDILVHKVSDTHYFLCVNAANQEKDYQHMVAYNKFDCEVELSSSRYAQLAIQGPKSMATLQKLTATDLQSVRYYHFVDGEVCGVPARIARSGYTGEVGFEIYFAPEHAEGLWGQILAAGEEFGIRPAGLGARNTLRLECAMALYGHEITASITPLEACLGRIVKFEKRDFLGRTRLLAQREQGVRRQLTGFEMTGRGIGRDGYEIFIDGVPAGWVTSGGPSPTLGKNIGLCYLPAAQAQPAQTIQVMVRNQPVDAVTRPIPFYKRAS